jgi:uncharacterized protein
LHRLVLDTNVLVAAGYAPQSASRKIVESCLARRWTPLVSTAVRAEYERMLRQALRREEYRPRLQALLESMERIEPAETPRVVPEDPDDDKLVALAVAGGATALISNDQHLLCLTPYRGIIIVTPGRFLERAGFAR